MLTEDQIAHYCRPMQVIHTELVQRGGPLTGIRAILFDIYGTLFISSTGDIAVSQKMILEQSEITRLLIRYQKEIPTDQISDQLILEIENEHDRLRKSGVEYPEVIIEQIWMKILEFEELTTARRFAAEYEMIVNPVYPMPYLEETLEFFRSKDLKMGIISNAQFYTPYLFSWFLNSSPEELGFKPELNLFSYQFGCAKPSARLFQVAADRLEEMGIKGSSVLYLGNDMLNDIFAASQAGFKTALFAGDARSLRLRKEHPACQQLTPDLVITDLAQLQTVFSN